MGNEEEKKKHFLINEHGEIVYKFDASTHYLRSKKQDEAFKKNQEGRNTSFTFTNMDAIHEVIDVLDDADLGYLLYLQCFIDYDGKLVNADRGKTNMTRKDVQETLGIGRSVFSKLWCAVTTLEIIEKNEKGVFYMNSSYHFKGTMKDEKVIRSFTTKVKELYSRNTAKDLGFIYKLLPYVHYETNTICHNPFETDPKQIQKLTQSEIAEIVGMDTSNIRRKMNRLTLSKEYVFAEVTVGRSKHYMVNPFLFYRKNGKPDATLTTIFTIRKPI